MDSTELESFCHKYNNLQVFSKIYTCQHSDCSSDSNYSSSDEERDIQDGTPSEDEILQEVIDEHLGLQQTQDDDEEELQERSLHSVKSARQALQVLIEFTEEQEALQSDYLRGLEHLEFALEALDQESRVQSTLDSWIT
ncbi:hypothetical protein VC83_06542 [Pseudogymnoascus destructans]|uniref:Uncharacterized protein n=1 Tax=Pseudogymnoascus destructans TaxID=655981 RepID=A0A177A8E1_9PEZI|nr:uncharacterized protein VC83_06542 [Pseudogymnoascus destructans]OAF58416.1 hypothetical protein VC83_06542 [Pseudogymnoascus destructans]